MLIAPLGSHNFILGKLWMNKHGVLLDLLTDKLLFRPGYCHHDGNEASPQESLVFTPHSRPKKNKPTMDKGLGGVHSMSEPDIPGQTAQEGLHLDIQEVSAAALYKNARDKRNKLFTLTLNEISAQATPSAPRRHRVMRNNPCPCGSQDKFKKCCGSNSKGDSPV